MLKRLRSLPFLGSAHTGFTAREYLLAAIGKPSLLTYAVRRVTSRKSRAVESALKASGNRSLYAPVSRTPESIDRIMERLAEHMAVLVIERNGTTCSLGVADVDLISALVLLSRTANGCEMRVDGQRVTFGTKNFKSTAMRAPYVEIRMVDEKMEPMLLTLEAYWRNEPAKWVSANGSNAVARAIYSDLLETPGVYLASDLIGGQTLAQMSRNEPVDVVYTWVNHDDPEWQRMFREHARAEPGGRSDSGSLSRFRNNEELRYSLRSVEAHLPWVNRIYIFTNCAKPSWMSEETGRLVWIDHKEVIPAEYLPTFSSHIIESFLHRIPGLSERFVYINDDVFVGRPLDKDFFFTEGGLSRSFLEPYGMVSGPVQPDAPDYLNASRNSSRKLQEQFGFVSTQLHKHTTFALLKSTLAEIEAMLGPELDEMRRGRFRRNTDFNITSFLYHHYAIFKGKASRARLDNVFVKSLDIRWKAMLAKALSRDWDIICINEGGVQNPSSDWHREVETFLSTRYPNKASWEK